MKFPGKGDFCFVALVDSVDEMDEKITGKC